VRRDVCIEVARYAQKPVRTLRSRRVYTEDGTDTRVSKLARAQCVCTNTHPCTTHTQHTHTHAEKCTNLLPSGALHRLVHARHLFRNASATNRAIERTVSASISPPPPPLEPFPTHLDNYFETALMQIVAPHHRAEHTLSCRQHPTPRPVKHTHTHIHTHRLTTNKTSKQTDRHTRTDN
jgi:hypothetical protein